MGPVMTATERYKTLFANAIERICVLEEQLELAQEQIAELDQTDPEERAVAD